MSRLEKHTIMSMAAYLCANGTYFCGLCGALLLIGWLLPKFVATPPWAPLFVLVPAYFFGGYYALREAIDSVRTGRFEIDFLMLVAAAGAAALGEWAEGALLLLLFSLGHALEGYAMGRAKRAIEALGALAPKTATVRRDARSKRSPSMLCGSVTSCW
ncbi:hypothetical protein ULG90_21075 [Halopseudomonas pachastrellae]|nr:hypothetical protein ULG90_21075 [Halopseudomonas pachastrellae]